MIARTARVASLVLACAACSESSAQGPGPVPVEDASDANVPGDGDLGEADADLPESGNDDGRVTDDSGPIGGDRPVDVHVPPGYTKGVPAPLVILLHGYSAAGGIEEGYLNLTELSDARGFLYAYPDGTVDALGYRFWNATDACCGAGARNVDDSSYLSHLIVEIEARYTIDPKKVFLVGHSNGGFMSYRMACDHSDQIAAIASLAGAMWADVTQCHAPAPVSVLEIHGTSDAVINYMGGDIAGNAYPSAAISVLDWATLDGCGATPDTSAPPLDLEGALPGDETTVTTYGSGCRPGGHAELWSIQGGSHVPTLGPNFTSDIVDFLLAHPKP
jgi:polyhydroxybutyrate depolymerase